MSPLLRNIGLVLAGALLIYLSARIAIPRPDSPVPYTLQNFGILVSGGALGFRRGGIAALVYLALGVVGLPFFAEGRGGLQVLWGATGGYILGFVLAAALVGRLAELGWDRRIGGAIGATLLGTMVIYLVGVPWLAVTDVGGDGSRSASFVLLVDPLTCWSGPVFRRPVVLGAAPATASTRPSGANHRPAAARPGSDAPASRRAPVAGSSTAFPAGPARSRGRPRRADDSSAYQSTPCQRRASSRSLELADAHVSERSWSATEPGWQRDPGHPRWNLARRMSSRVDMTRARAPAQNASSTYTVSRPSCVRRPLAGETRRVDAHDPSIPHQQGCPRGAMRRPLVGRAHHSNETTGLDVGPVDRGKAARHRDWPAETGPG